MSVDLFTKRKTLQIHYYKLLLGYSLKKVKLEFGSFWKMTKLVCAQISDNLFNYQTILLILWTFGIVFNDFEDYYLTFS